MLAKAPIRNTMWFDITQTVLVLLCRHTGVAAANHSRGCAQSSRCALCHRRWRLSGCVWGVVTFRRWDDAVSRISQRCLRPEDRWDPQRKARDISIRITPQASPRIAYNSIIHKSKHGIF